MTLLTDQQREQLILLLVEAFRRREDMQAALFIHLGVNFDALASTGAYGTDLVYLLDAAETDGWTRRLLDALRKANSGNRALQDFLEPFDLSPEALTQEPQVIPLRYRRQEKEHKYTPPPLPDPNILPPPARRDELPPGFTLPLLRNENFTGRETDLLALAERLLYEPQSSALIAHGMGGSGKTQLAAEFCYRYGRFFQGVHWIQINPTSEKPEEEIRQGIVTCGEAMNLQPWPDDFEGKIRRTLQAWADDSPRLVVLDNLEDDEVLLNLLMELRGCRVLVTARRGVWPRGKSLQLHPLGLLSPAESRELLTKLCLRLGSESDNDLDELAERLGRLPLALVLAGYYLAERTDLTLSGYVKALDTSPVFDDPAFQAWIDASDMDHSTDLAATFRLSWNALAGETREDVLARSAFLACGWLAPNTPIPVNILSGAALNQGEDPAPFFKALRRLYELGLLAESPGGPRVHPLLAEFSRLQAADNESLKRTADALTHAASEANQRGYPREAGPYHSHMETCLTFSMEKSLLDRAALLMHNLAYLQQDKGDFSGAKQNHENALKIDREVWGENHPNTAVGLNNLGLLLQVMGDLDEAKPYLEQALQIWQKYPGDEKSDLASGLNNLGALHQDMGDLKGAMHYVMESLKILREFKGDNNVATAAGFNNLGTLLLNVDNLDGAKQCFEQALAIYQKHDANHPNAAASLDNLGSVLQRTGELVQAQQYFEEALAIRQSVFVELHPATANSFNNLGSLLKDLGDFDGARRNFEQALVITRKTLGEKHPDTANILNNLGMLLRDMMDPAGARLYLDQALAIRRERLGENHLITSQSLNNIGLILMEIGELTEARSYLEQALAFRRKLLGDQHTETANTRLVFISLLLLTGEKDAALREYEIIRSVLQQVKLPESHPYVRLMNVQTGQGNQEN